MSRLRLCPRQPYGDVLAAGERNAEPSGVDAGVLTSSVAFFHPGYRISRHVSPFYHTGTERCVSGLSVVCLGIIGPIWVRCALLKTRLDRLVVPQLAQQMAVIALDLFELALYIAAVFP